MKVKRLQMLCQIQQPVPFLKTNHQSLMFLLMSKIYNTIISDWSIKHIFNFSIHLKIEDKITVRIGRDGGVQGFELSGLLTLKIADEKYGRIKIQLENNDKKGIQMQTHPNVDKDLFRSKSQIGLKNPTKPFPINTDVGVLKWRYQTQDETAIPLTSN